MSEKPEALRLIQHMDDEYPEDWDGRAIRAELRRQHAEIERLTADNEALRRDAEKWRKSRAKYIAWQKGGKAEAMEDKT